MNDINDMIVDKVVYADDWAKGYLNGELVVGFGGVSDIGAIKLYDADGNLVVPVPAQPAMDQITQLELALAELAGIVAGGG
jgi:hypothetical protein